MLNWIRSIVIGLLYMVLVCTPGLLLAACGSPSLRGVPPAGTPALSLSTGKILAAIGMQPQEANGAGAGDTTLRDRRLAYGLTNLLAESFYETGKFRLLEGKNLNQHQLLEELVDLFSQTSRPSPSNRDLSGIGERLEADLLAYGKIGYTKSSGQRIQVGPVGRYQQKLRVNVEVCLFEVSSQMTLCRAGEGSAQQEGVGAVYEFRHDRPEFEKNAAGLATKLAVTSAVHALMASIQFIP
jgi:hypothetical protein